MSPETRLAIVFVVIVVWIASFIAFYNYQVEQYDNRVQGIINSVVDAINTCRLEYKNGLLVLMHQKSAVPVNITVTVMYAYKMKADSYVVGLNKQVNILNISGVPDMVVIHGYGAILTYKYNGTGLMLIAYKPPSRESISIALSLPRERVRVVYSDLWNAVLYATGISIISIIVLILFLRYRSYGFTGSKR